MREKIWQQRGTRGTGTLPELPGPGDRCFPFDCSVKAAGEMSPSERSSALLSRPEAVLLACRSGSVLASCAYTFAIPLAPSSADTCTCRTSPAQFPCTASAPEAGDLAPRSGRARTRDQPQGKAQQSRDRANPSRPGASPSFARALISSVPFTDLSRSSRPVQVLTGLGDPRACPLHAITAGSRPRPAQIRISRLPAR